MFGRGFPVGLRRTLERPEPGMLLPSPKNAPVRLIDLFRDICLST